MFETEADTDLDDLLSLEFNVTPIVTKPHNEVAFKKPEINQFYKKVEANPRGLKRMFPGPAGLLYDDFEANESVQNNKNEDTFDVACSQTSANIFNHTNWLQMQQDFAQTTRNYNISWIKEQATGKFTLSQKIPFLAAIISKIDSIASKTPNIELKDETGTINAVINHDLFDAHTKDIQIGSVLVLKRLSILIMGPQSGPSHFLLTITLNNLITIYNANHNNENATQAKSGLLINNNSGCDVIGLTNTQSSCVSSMQIPTFLTPNQSNPHINIFDSDSCEFDANINLNLTPKDNSQILEEALSGIDTDSFFEDF